MPAAISKPKGEPLFRRGAPPVPGKAVMRGKSVAVGAPAGAVGAPAVAVGAPAVAVGVPFVAVAVDVAVGSAAQIGPLMVLESSVT